MTIHRLNVVTLLHSVHNVSEMCLLDDILQTAMDWKASRSPSWDHSDKAVEQPYLHKSKTLENVLWVSFTCSSSSGNGTKSGVRNGELVSISLLNQIGKRKLPAMPTFMFCPKPLAVELLQIFLVLEISALCLFNSSAREVINIISPLCPAWWEMSPKIPSCILFLQSVRFSWWDWSHLQSLHLFCSCCMVSLLPFIVDCPLLLFTSLSPSSSWSNWCNISPSNSSLGY